MTTGNLEDVAMLFSDVEGSTALAARLGDAWLDVLVAQRSLCREAWRRWDGTEMGTEGDSFFVVFPEPAAAVEAALRAQEAIAAHAWPAGAPVRVRMGIHTGSARRHENGFVGLDVHRAARISAAAHGGQLLVSGPVERAVRDRMAAECRVRHLGAHLLKDIPEREDLYQVWSPGMPSVFPPPRVGDPATRLGGVADYRFIRQLGESARGGLYLAVPPSRLGGEHELVTVKVVRGAAEAATVRRMTRELRAFAQVRSPHVVRLLDAGQADDLFFYAMEYHPQGSLAAPEQPLDAARVRRAVHDAALAVQALHEAGLVHRGVKPSNVLVTPEGGRLADLGLVQSAEPTHSLTSLGTVSAVEFTDPRLVSGAAPGPSSDVWSLAATLHWALAGEGLYGPMPGEDPLYCVRKVLTSGPRVSARLDPVDADLVRSVLEAGPADRMTAADLAAALTS